MMRGAASATHRHTATAGQDEPSEIILLATNFDVGEMGIL